MVRSFLNRFERLLAGGEVKRTLNVRTHAAASVPAVDRSEVSLPTGSGADLDGTLLTGEMFAPILEQHIERYNRARGTRLHVVAVPNTYFGGDVSVAGLLSGQDLVAVRDRVVGRFAIIPKVTIKSDEPIMIDGMSYDDLKSQFPVPVYDMDTDALISFLSKQ